MTIVAVGQSCDHVLHVKFDVVMRCRSVRDDACYGMNNGSSSGSSKEFDEGGSVILSALDTAQGTAAKPFVIDDDDDDDDDNDDDKTALDLSMPSAARPLLFKAAA